MDQKCTPTASRRLMVALSPKGRGTQVLLRPRFSVATLRKSALAISKNAPLARRRSGSGRGPCLPNLLTGAVLPRPPVFFPQPACWPCRGKALPLGSIPRATLSPGSRAGLGGSSPSGAPLRRQPGTVALTRYPVRTELPARAMAGIILQAERVDCAPGSGQV
jgi:hypothetical protein